MTKYTVFFVLPFFAFVVSCNSISHQNAYDEVEYTSTEGDESDVSYELDDVVEDHPMARPVYQATETVLTDLIHTKLEVNFDWSKSRMNGTAYITAKPHFYPSDSLILDAKGMEINSVSINNTPLTYTYKDDFLKIKLDKTYTRNDKYSVKINYVAKPDERETGGSHAITSDKGLYFINPKGEDKSKMPQIWTQGETEASSVWFPTIDSPNTKTTQEIYITVDSKYVTLSNGKLISSTNNSNGTRTDYWKQDLPHAPYLFMMGVGEFKVVKDFYTRPDGSKIEVNYYVEPAWESSAKAIFGETPKMIGYFSKLLGVEYPWDKYSQIVVRDYVSGAMENTGAVVFGDYAYKTERELLDENDQSTIAHELFHHWFGDLVTCESWSNLTLNESFANYSQYLWDEYRFGLDEAAYQAEVEADGYYMSAQSDGYHDLVWFDYDDKEQMFDGHSYNKGGRILHMLRNYIGDEAFFKALNIYLTNNKFKAGEFHQLRLAFEEVCGEDLNWFFNQWYLGSGHPILDINQTNDKVNKTVKVSIQQSQDLALSPIFKLPMHIAVFDSLGKHVHKVVVDKLSNEFVLPYSGTLNCVIVDDQQMLLAKIREEKPLEQYVYQYYNGKTYKARKDALIHGTASENKHPEQLIMDALNDPFWNIRSIALEQFNKMNDEAKKQAVPKVKTMAQSDSSSQIRSDAFSVLDGNLEEKELEALLLERIEKDQSYLVISTCLAILGKTNPEVALTVAKKHENEISSSVISRIGNIYSGHGSTEAFGFFEKHLTGSIVTGFDQVELMNSFTLYLSKQPTEVIDKAFPVYEHLRDNGGYYTKMFFPQYVKYFVGLFETKIQELNSEIEAHEKNKDAAYADQARQKIKAYEALSLKYASLNIK